MSKKSKKLLREEEDEEERHSREEDSSDEEETKSKRRSKSKKIGNTSNWTESFIGTFIRPFCIAAAGAFGMSVGKYTFFSSPFCNPSVPDD
jgi:hypothetical protein